MYHDHVSARTSTNHPPVVPTHNCMSHPRLSTRPRGRSRPLTHHSGIARVDKKVWVPCGYANGSRGSKKQETGSITRVTVRKLDHSEKKKRNVDE